MSFGRGSVRVPVRKPTAKASPEAGGLNEREMNRRLVGLGLSRKDPPAIITEALKIIERFHAWMRQRRCAASGHRSGERMEYQGELWYVTVEVSHNKSRGSFGADIGNCVPLVDLLHKESHRDPDFWPGRGVDPVSSARNLAIGYLRDHPDDGEWLRLHAQDGDVLALVAVALPIMETQLSEPDEDGVVL